MQNMKDIAMLLAINHMTGSQSETCVSQMATADLSALKDSYMKEYEAYQCKKWKLDMSRGKPGPDQLVLSAPERPIRFRWNRLPQLRMPGWHSGGKRADGQPFGAAGRKYDRRRQLQPQYDV